VEALSRIITIGEKIPPAIPLSEGGSRRDKEEMTSNFVLMRNKKEIIV
jgi:hypothetical protein